MHIKAQKKIYRHEFDKEKVETVRFQTNVEMQFSKSFIKFQHFLDINIHHFISIVHALEIYFVIIHFASANISYAGWNAVIDALESCWLFLLLNRIRQPTQNF